MKRVGSVLLCLCVLSAALCAFAACGAKSEYDGTYYNYTNGHVKEDYFLKIKGDKWTMVNGDVSIGGTYTVEDGELTLLYTLTGDEDVDPVFEEKGSVVALYGGAIEDGRIKLTKWNGRMAWPILFFYLDGKVPEEGNGASATSAQPNRPAEEHYK